jgi:predicted dehydrogenase
VYVEKPVTHTIEQGDVLQRAVTQSKQVVQVGYQQRSWDIFQMAHDLIGAGKLGKVVLVLSYWYQNYLRRGAPPHVDTGKLDWKRCAGESSGPIERGPC